MVCRQDDGGLSGSADVSAIKISFCQEHKVVHVNRKYEIKLAR